MPITTVEDLRNDNGWEPTMRLRWLGITLQQRWDNPASGKTEWRDLPEVADPAEHG